MVARHILTCIKQAGSAPQDTISVYKLHDSDTFPSLKFYIQVAYTVPFSSCTCEKFLSILRHLQT